MVEENPNCFLCEFSGKEIPADELYEGHWLCNPHAELAKLFTDDEF